MNRYATIEMGRYYTFEVEEFYSNRSRVGRVFLTDEEADRIIGLLQEEMEASIYTSDMEKKMPEIYHKIDDAAEPLMEEILKDLEKEEYGPEDPMFRVWVPEELIDRAGLDPIFC